LTRHRKPAANPDAARRQRAERLGRMAEVIAIGWLAVQFYRIQAWRWKCPSGEVDLIARRGQRLVFIEVKFRSRRGDAAAPGQKQRARIIRAAEDFAKRRRISPNLEWRFDLIQIGWPSKDAPWLLRHLPHAWDASAVKNRFWRP
tara:strand:- start:1259 stop:1693 length:435 start_codon:yes stop_codon:yes gene_type:complete